MRDCCAKAVCECVCVYVCVCMSRCVCFMYKNLKNISGPR